MSEADTIRELVQFLLRPEYDWVEDWEEAREMAAKAKPALTALERRAEHWKERTQQVFAERDDAINEKHAAWSRAEAAERRAEQAEGQTVYLVDVVAKLTARAEQAEATLQRLASPTRMYAGVNWEWDEEHRARLAFAEKALAATTPGEPE